MKPAASSSTPIKRNRPRIICPPRLAPLALEIAVAPHDFNRNGPVLRDLEPPTEGVARPCPALTMAKGALIRRAKWRRAEILPPMFFQEQFGNTYTPRAAIVTHDRRRRLRSEG